LEKNLNRTNRIVTSGKSDKNQLLTKKTIKINIKQQNTKKKKRKIQRKKNSKNKIT